MSDLQMLERAAQTGRNQWQLLRVAIVDLRDEVFIGEHLTRGRVLRPQ